MRLYKVTLAYDPKGFGSTITITISASSEFHACQLAQSQNPGMYALKAAPA